MYKAILVFIVIVMLGYMGLWIAPEFGIIFSIAAAAAFIVSTIEKHTRNDY